MRIPPILNGSFCEGFRTSARTDLARVTGGRCPEASREGTREIGAPSGAEGLWGFGGADRRRERFGRSLRVPIVVVCDHLTDRRSGCACAPVRQCERFWRPAATLGACEAGAGQRPTTVTTGEVGIEGERVAHDVSAPTLDEVDACGCGRYTPSNVSMMKRRAPQRGQGHGCTRGVSAAASRSALRRCSSSAGSMLFTRNSSRALAKRPRGRSAGCGGSPSAAHG